MNPQTRARVRAHRELTRHGYGPLYDRLQQILLAPNPAALDLTRGDVRDDYGLPVGSLIPKLHTLDERNLPRLLHDHMRHRYGDAAGPLEHRGGALDSGSSGNPR